MSLPITREWAERYLAPTCWLRAVTPQTLRETNWRDQVRHVNDKLAAGVMAEVQRIAISQSSSPAMVLRNIIALVNTEAPPCIPGLSLVLQRYAPDSIPEAVLTRVLREANTSPWIWLFSGQEASRGYRRTPELLPDTDLALRLRVIRDQGTIAAEQLFSELADFPDVRQSTLAGAINRALDGLRITEPLELSRFRHLPTRLRRLLVQWPDLMSVLVEGSDADHSALRAPTMKRRHIARSIRRRAKHFLRHVQHRETALADKLAKAIALSSPTRDELDLFAARANVALATPKRRESNEGRWPPITEAAANLLTLMLRAPSDQSLLTTLSTPRSQLMDRLLAAPDCGELGQLSVEDSDVLKKRWSKSQRKRLVQGGKFTAIPQIDSEIVQQLARPLALQMHIPEVRGAIIDSLDNPVVARAVVAAAENGSVAATSLLPEKMDPQIGEVSILVALLQQSSPLVEAAYQGSQTKKSRWLDGQVAQEALFTWSHGRSNSRQRSVWNSRVVKWLSGHREPEHYPWLVKMLAARLPESTVLLLTGASAPLIRAVLADMVPAQRMPFWAQLQSNKLLYSAERQTALSAAIQLLLPTLTSAELLSVANCFPVLQRSAILHSRKQPPGRLTETFAAMGTAFGFKSLNQPTASTMNQAIRQLEQVPARSGALALAGTLGLKWMPRIATAAVASIRRLTSRGGKLDDYYRSYPLPKQSGGTRTILVPAAWLKGLQRRIYQTLLRPLGAHSNVHGFVPGRSIVSNAQPHTGKAIVVTCDIASAFPSMSWSLVLHALRRDLATQLPGPAISLLVDICCHNGGLPIGAPTSPALLNRILLPADEIFTAEALKRGLSYSRYADDLTFSGGNEAPGMLPIVRRVLGGIGLRLDDKKTNVFRRGRRQMVTGLTVNERVNVPRRLRRRLRAAVHRQSTGLSPQWQGTEMSATALVGHLHYLSMVNRAYAQHLLDQLDPAP